MTIQKAPMSHVIPSTSLNDFNVTVSKSEQVEMTGVRPGFCTAAVHRRKPRSCTMASDDVYLEAPPDRSQSGPRKIRPDRPSAPSPPRPVGLTGRGGEKDRNVTPRRGEAPGSRKGPARGRRWLGWSGEFSSPVRWLGALFVRLLFCESWRVELSR